MHRDVPFSVPNFRDADYEQVVASLKSGWLTHGPFSTSFEESFANFTSSNFAVSVNSCTAALHLGMKAIGVTVGDEVIVPAMTHAATAHAAEYCGAKVFFADCEKFNGNVTLESIERLVGKKTKAIVIVHMAGIPCEVEKISNFCKRNKIFLIEDCAHAIGTTVDGKHVGTFGDLGAFSFYPTKQITTGEGGMLTTNNEELAAFVRKERGFGIDTRPEERVVPGLYNINSLGYNYRLSDFQSALGLGQLQRYGPALEARKKNAALFKVGLNQIDSELIYVNSFPSGSSHFLFQTFILGELRNSVSSHLKKNGVGHSIHYATPVNKLNYYSRKYPEQSEACAHAKSYADSVLSLPCHQNITSSDIDYIVETLNYFIAKHS